MISNRKEKLFDIVFSFSFIYFFPLPKNNKIIGITDKTLFKIKSESLKLDETKTSVLTVHCLKSKPNKQLSVEEIYNNSLATDDIEIKLEDLR